MNWLATFGYRGQSQMRRVVVIGAGVAGLAAAQSLRLAGIATVVLERASVAGGRAQRHSPGLVSRLTRGVELRLNCAVSRVAHTAKGAVVWSGDGPFDCHAVVVTLPVAVLQRQWVRVDGLEAGRQAAIQRLAAAQRAWLDGDRMLANRRDVDTLAAPLGDRVYFAGDAVCWDGLFTTRAAQRSGHAAAARIGGAA